MNTAIFEVTNNSIPLSSFIYIFIRIVLEKLSEEYQKLKNIHTSVIPKATNSLGVLIDIPIAVVLMFQLYRESIEVIC